MKSGREKSIQHSIIYNRFYEVKTHWPAVCETCSTVLPIKRIQRFLQHALLAFIYWLCCNTKWILDFNPGSIAKHNVNPKCIKHCQTQFWATLNPFLHTSIVQSLYFITPLLRVLEILQEPYPAVHFIISTVHCFHEHAIKVKYILCLCTNRCLYM